MLPHNAPDLLFSTDMKTWVKDAVAVVDLRAKITLKARFIFSYFTNNMANYIDTSLCIRPPNIHAAVEGNPNISTWTGRRPPWGYLAWWPVCLGFNVLEEPFDNPQIRWAINHAINREQLVEVGVPPYARCLYAYGPRHGQSVYDG